MLSASDVLQYEDRLERYAALRVAVQRVGIKRVARMSGVLRSQVQRLVNYRTPPNAATLAKIEPALRQLR